MIRSCRWLAAVLVLICLPVQAGSSAPNILTAAGADEHIWFLLPSEQPIGQWDLCHVGRRPGAVSYRVVRHLAHLPVAMSAWGNTLWIAMRSSYAREDTWDIYKLQAKYQASMDLDLMEPRDGLGPLPPLTGLDAIEAMAGTPTGPVVIGTRDGELAGMQLSSGKWGEIELPAELPPGDSSKVFVTGCCGPDGLALVLEDAGSITFWTRGGDGAWIESADPMTGQAMALISVDGHPLLVLSSSGGEIELTYIQFQPTLLTGIAQPEGAWAVVGLRGSALVLSVQGGKVVADHVDALTGVRESFEMVRPKGMIASSIWSIAVAIGLASMVIMIIVLARGGDLATGMLPPGTAPMQPMVRLLALCIDLVPGLLVFFLVTSGSLRDLVRVPMMSMSTEDVVPYAWLVLVTVCWCVLWELAIGTSMGKGLCGGRIRSTTGANLKARQILIRNIIKGLVLLVPPLAILTLLHPNQQGLGDLLARTVVIRPAAQPHDT